MFLYGKSDYCSSSSKRGCEMYRSFIFLVHRFPVDFFSFLWRKERSVDTFRLEIVGQYGVVWL